MSMRVGPFTEGMVATDNLIFFIDGGNPNSFDSDNSLWKDLSGNAQDADVSTVSYANPDVNFDGTTSIASFDVGPLSPLVDLFQVGGTVAAWIRIESDGEGNTGAIVDKTGWYFHVENESGGEVDLAFGTLNATFSGKWASGALDTITLNTWVHVAVSFTSLPVDSEDPVFYINGNVVTPDEDTTPSGAEPGDSTNPLTVGNDDATGRTFDGDINVVKIWNKVLTLAEITAEYNSILDRFTS